MNLANEHGFGDYTAPGTGGMAGFAAGDYADLLADLVAARMNSVCVSVKWLTTGYRSRLQFLDQHERCLLVRSDNELLRDFFRGCRRHGVKPWLTAAPLISHVIKPAQCKAAYEGLSFDRLNWSGVVLDGRE